MCANLGTVFCGLGNVAPGASSPTVDITLRASSVGSKVTTVSVSSGTIDPNGGNNSRSLTTNVTPLRAQREAAVTLEFESEITVPGSNSTVEGQIVLNQTTAVQVVSGARRIHHYQVVESQIRVDGTVNTDLRTRGHWRFEFGGSPAFLPGSIKVLSGEVLSLAGTSVVFAVHSDAAPVQFTFELKSE